MTLTRAMDTTAYYYRFGSLFGIKSCLFHATWNAWYGQFAHSSMVYGHAKAWRTRWVKSDAKPDLTLNPPMGSVSVVIPTKNGGRYFEELMKSLVCQVGLIELEIIVVDSGSTDGTVDIAKQIGAKVIQINSEDFSHSYARNLGAQHATHEFLFFTVQDACLQGEDWLAQAVQLTAKHPDVSAFSFIEEPRPDADLYYKFISHGHSKMMGVLEQDQLLEHPGLDAEHEQLRRNSNLSNVACLIPKDVFEQYRFAGNYAEDLNLGYQLIQDKNQLLLSKQLTVLHSHNRPTSYYLKRAFFDTQYISEIFNIDQTPQSSNWRTEISQLLYLLSTFLDSNFEYQSFPENILMLIDTLKHADPSIQSNNQISDYFDDEAKCFFQTILSRNEPMQSADHAISKLGNGGLKKAFIEQLCEFLIFINLNSSNNKRSRHSNQEIASSICKIFCCSVGQYLYAQSVSNQEIVDAFETAVSRKI